MTAPDPKTPSTLTAISRGAIGRCPRCGKGSLLYRYLKIVDCCSVCGEPYGHFRTDDAAPWLTILVVGHITIPIVLIFEHSFKIAMALALAIFAPDSWTDLNSVAAMQGSHCCRVVGDESRRFRKDLRRSDVAVQLSAGSIVGHSPGTGKAARRWIKQLIHIGLRNLLATSQHIVLTRSQSFEPNW
jgi:uncharacterized protein (DUF983 family)